MTFIPASGSWTVHRTPTKAQVTYTEGMMLINDATNDVPVTAQSQFGLRGIVVDAKASSAATTHISLQVPTSPSCTFYGDMTTGETLDPANVGVSYDFAAGALTVSTNNTYRPVTLVKYISTTKGEFQFASTTGIED